MNRLAKLSRRVDRLYKILEKAEDDLLEEQIREVRAKNKDLNWEDNTLELKILKFGLDNRIHDFKDAFSSMKGEKLI